MILAITGGHGSGKTHLVASVCRRFEHIDFVDDPRGLTRAPVAMLCGTHNGVRTAVIGQYVTMPFSGTDSGRFGGRVDELYAWMAGYSNQGRIVVAEGMLLAGTWRRLQTLTRQNHDVRVLYIDEPLDVCLSSIAERKARRGPTHNRSKLPVNERIITEKYRSIRNTVSAMEAEKMVVTRANRVAALNYVLDALDMKDAVEEFRLR